jgi:hypothetical protein
MDHAEVPTGAKWITGSAGSSGANGSSGSSGTSVQMIKEVIKWWKWIIGSAGSREHLDRVVLMIIRKCRKRGTSGKWIIRKCRIKGKWIIRSSGKWIRVQVQAEHLAMDHQEAGSWKCRIAEVQTYGTSNGWCKSSGSWIISFWVKWNIWVKVQMGQVDHQVFQCGTSGSSGANGSSGSSGVSISGTSKSSGTSVKEVLVHQVFLDQVDHQD